MSSNPVREQALRELEEFEAAAFRFGQQARAFLANLPEDLPGPDSVLPRFAGRSESGTGRYLPGAGSYLHLTFEAVAEVAPWAARLGESVKFSVDEPGERGQSFGTCSATGVLNGVEVYAGAGAFLVPEEWQRLQDEAARLVEDSPGGGE